MSDRSAAHLVLVEDHTLVRQLLAHVLRQEPGVVLGSECTTLADARAALLTENPDLVIVDWMLPDGRGFDLVRELGARLPRTRWLFMSSNERGHLVREAVSLGIQGFVQKRSDLAAFREGLRRVLAGEKFYCPQSAQLLVDKLVEEGRTSRVVLTSREREVLRGFARGENPKGLASRLGISLKTVQNHLTALKDKLALREPAELVHYAIRHGYIETP